LKPGRTTSVISRNATYAAIQLRSEHPLDCPWKKAWTRPRDLYQDYDDKHSILNTQGYTSKIYHLVLVHEVYQNRWKDRIDIRDSSQWRKGYETSPEEDTEEDSEVAFEESSGEHNNSEMEVTAGAVTTSECKRFIGR
jgi:hypothetical protein